MLISVPKAMASLEQVLSAPILRATLLSCGLVCGLFFSGCTTVKRAAVGSLADTLASGGDLYASDEDPELVKAAVPFSLKLMEGTLGQTPKHKGLLLASCSGFTQYAYAFVLPEAERLEQDDYSAAEAVRLRARKLLLRARVYGLRGLEVDYPGFSDALAADPAGAVARLKRGDVPLIYWTAASWGAALGVAKDDPLMVGQIPQIEALIDRAYVLEKDWGEGALDSFLISYEMLRQGQSGDPSERARAHYERAVSLSSGRLAGPHVTWAEAVCVENRDVEAFDRAIEKALAVDPDKSPAHRLENIIMQTRARWLKSRREDLFLLPSK